MITYQTLKLIVEFLSTKFTVITYQTLKLIVDILSTKFTCQPTWMFIPTSLWSCQPCWYAASIFQYFCGNSNIRVSNTTRLVATCPQETLIVSIDALHIAMFSICSNMIIWISNSLWSCRPCWYVASSFLRKLNFWKSLIARGVRAYRVGTGDLLVQL